MKLSEVLAAVKGGNFTCSSGAQLLSEQPTADEVSHAHIHALDPFQVDVSKIKPDSFKAPSTVQVSTLLDGRKKFWENPELHLNPADGIRTARKSTIPHRRQNSSLTSSIWINRSWPLTILI